MLYVVMTEYAELRKILVAQRQRLKLSQRVVAARMGTMQSALSELETGATRSPSVETVAKWARAVELDVRFVLQVREARETDDVDEILDSLSGDDHWSMI